MEVFNVLALNCRQYLDLVFTQLNDVISRIINVVF